MPRPFQQPAGQDLYRDSPRSPDPLLSVKHVHNPTIVTVFGAGIAGLTAAHELASRGFLVQVVEAKRDRYSKGRPQVGGLAATQYARIRANIADLHPDLLKSASGQDDAVRQAFLQVFAFNRSWWIQTEDPIEIHDSLYSDPEAAPAFAKGIVDALQAGRGRFRERWLWDLIVRSILIGQLRKSGTDVSASSLQDAADFYQELCAKSTTPEVGRWILEKLRTDQSKPRGRRPASSLPPWSRLSQRDKAALEHALEREFLYFRLIPCARAGSEDGLGRARTLLRAWERFFKRKGLEHNLSESSRQPRLQVVPSALPAPGENVPAHADVWLELQVIEKRLPGEHGFRFFPAYYRHLDDTMSRTPIYVGGQYAYRSALDNLCTTTVETIGLSEKDRQEIGSAAKQDKGPVEVRRDPPKTLQELRDRIEGFYLQLGCTQKDVAMFAARVLRLMTSSKERRKAEYEKRSWRSFVGTSEDAPGDGTAKLPYSPAMVRLIESTAQCLLALSAGEADARTYGDAEIQLFLDLFKSGAKTDRTLNGPTSDAWLEPWREHLERLGVRFFLGKLTGLHVHSRTGELVPEIRNVDGKAVDLVAQDGHTLLQYDPSNPGSSPDFYVLALDIKKAHDLIDQAKLSPGKPRGRDTEHASRDFLRLHDFYEKIEPRGLKDMTGVQFFFDAKTSIGKGHMYFPYSEWGLSSISQSEFWSERGNFADGYQGVLSVDVSHVTQPHSPSAPSFQEVLAQRLPQPKVLREAAPTKGRQKDAARVSSGADDKVADDKDAWYGRRLVAYGVWKELRDRIAKSDQLAEPRAFHVDTNIAGAPKWSNASRYLAALPNTWSSRPGLADDGSVEYSVNHKRWVLCGTFMATYTRMTTMEAANESARHAVRAILKALADHEQEEPGAITLNGRPYAVEGGESTTYNGASKHRRYDPPDIYDPEDNELDALDVLRRLDENLLKLKLPHWMDICDFDQRLALLLDMSALEANGLNSAFTDEKRRSELIRFLFGGIETSMQQAFGPDYKLEDPLRQLLAFTLKKASGVEKITLQTITTKLAEILGKAS